MKMVTVIASSVCRSRHLYYILACHQTLATPLIVITPFPMSLRTPLGDNGAVARVAESAMMIFKLKGTSISLVELRRYHAVILYGVYADNLCIFN